jgi:hypothetical protein
MDTEFDRPSSGEALDELRKALQNVEDADIDKLFERMQKPNATNALNTPLFDVKSDTQKTRAKTSLRMQYEAQVQITQKNFGSLEEIRQKLGLSKRKICQILLIDPSTWTRWTTFNNQSAPPHIFRMLEWYLLLQEKHPSLSQNFWLSSVTSHASKSEISHAQIRKLEEAITQKVETKLQNQMQALQQQRQTEKRKFIAWGFLAGIALSILIYFISAK